MALIHRLSRLFTADVHAVLDRLEDPDVLLHHAIREMEEALARDEQRRRLLEHESAALDERNAKIEVALGALGAELDACFADRNDDLARKVIKRRLETERLGQLVAERRAALETELKALRRTLDERHEQVAAMREKAELLAGSPKPDEWTAPRTGVSDDDVEIALLRERQRRQTS